MKTYYTRERRIVVKNIKGYVNLKNDLDLIKENIDYLKEKRNTISAIIENLEKEEIKMESTKETMESFLKELKGVEQELAINILVKGFNPTRSVDKVAYSYDLNPSTIWKIYYPKVKKMIDEMLITSESKEQNII